MKTIEPNIIVQKEIQSQHGLIQLRSDNILVFRPDVSTFKDYSLEVLRDLRDDFVEITDGIPRPYMADNRHITGIVSKEEKAFINKHAGEFATQMAILTYSPVMNVLVNSYNAVFKPKVDVKLFRAENDALTWLSK